MNSDKKFCTVELELTNGDRIIRTFNTQKLYSFRQITKNKYRLCRNFPFIKREKVVYTRFRYQDTFESMRDSNDSCFYVNCSIDALMNTFGFTNVSWSEILLKDAIRNG